MEQRELIGITHALSPMRVRREHVVMRLAAAMNTDKPEQTLNDSTFGGAWPERIRNLQAGHVAAEKAGPGLLVVKCKGLRGSMECATRRLASNQSS